MSRLLAKLLFNSILLLSLISLAACGENSDETNTSDSGEISGKVTMWTASLSGEPFDSYFSDIEKGFEKKYSDVDVIIEDIPQEQMEQKVLTSLTGSEVPDLVNLNPLYVANIAGQGGLLDLTDLIDEKTKDSFVEGPFKAGINDDSLYALPWYLTTTVTWYNNEHFEQAGIEELPTTLDGIYETAKKISDKTGKASYYPVINDGNVIMQKMVSLANGDPIVKDGKAVFEDNQAILKYFETMQKMYEEGLIPQEAAEGSIQSGQELYMGGNISFLEGGVTFLGPVESGAPNIYKTSKSGPPLVSEDAPINVDVMNFAIPSKTKNQEAAVELLKYITNAENQLEFAKIAGTVLPSTKDSLDDSYFKEAGDSPKAQGMMQASKALERAEVLIPPTENSADVREATKNIFVQNLQGELSSEEALSQLAEEWTKSFEETGEDVTF
ncbi:sugar ABC transporter substrate-binding protein [Lentibacillus populi]|uniref:Sugar ABC transporter substrate-binding protein n=1 Tax=Lentibacillus populi TaxID=1827502 RepID=A0A9W5X5H2_9BACI|nr:sugar ABC transporter substrate-binding protein [Lentibacillus populi]GGB43820.1 sugar ABC transporter substrate-binding protein [Lentibacillus populi]